MLKGNHDYWWSSLNKLNRYLEDNNLKNIKFLHNNSFEIEGNIIAGTRGWGIGSKEAEDEKIIARELLRLEMSIKSGIENFGDNKPIIVCMHYPPTNRDLREESDFIKLMKKYNVKRCLYGHLHGEALEKEVIEGNLCGIQVELISSDYLNFKVKKL